MVRRPPAARPGAPGRSEPGGVRPLRDRAGRQLPDRPTPDDIARSGLADTFRRGDVDTFVDLGAEGAFKSDERLDGLLALLPADMRARVDRGELAFAWIDIGGEPSLVVGGRPAGGGPAFYFVRDVSEIGEAIDQLRLALAVGAIALLVIALIIARRVARGILAPVEEAGQVAERIERGDLSARVPVTSRDEFGTWAERFNDMTAALSDTIRRLEAAQHQNRRFVADVSHELRTPLAALVAEASIVGEHLDEMPSESRRAAELLVADVGRLRTLVEELMELSRFDADAEQVALEPVDLVRLVRAVIAARLPSAILRPARAVDRRGHGSAAARPHPRQFPRQRSRARGRGRVEVTVEPRPDELVIAVSDRGPGVPSDRLDHIFERFAKLDPSRSGGSSGLGLAIAAEHAALLDGYLQAMNRDGGGLRLELVLPLAVTRSLPDGVWPVNRALDAGAPPSITREPTS